MIIINLRVLLSYKYCLFSNSISIRFCCISFYFHVIKAALKWSICNTFIHTNMHHKVFTIWYKSYLICHWFPRWWGLIMKVLLLREQLISRPAYCSKKIYHRTEVYNQQARINNFTQLIQASSLVSSLQDFPNSSQLVCTKITFYTYFSHSI